MPFKRDNILMGKVRQYYMFKDGSLCEITLIDNSKLYLKITGNTWDTNGSKLIGYSNVNDVTSCNVAANGSLSVLSVVSQAQDINSIYQLAPIIVTLSKLKSLYCDASNDLLPGINKKLENIHINAHTTFCAFHDTAERRSNFKAFTNADESSLLVSDCIYVGLLFQHIIHLLPE